MKPWQSLREKKTEEMRTRTCQAVEKETRVSQGQPFQKLKRAAARLRAREGMAPEVHWKCSAVGRRAERSHDPDSQRGRRAGSSHNSDSQRTCVKGRCPGSVSSLAAQEHSGTRSQKTGQYQPVLLIPIKSKLHSVPPYQFRGVLSISY